MAGIMAALIARDDIESIREEIDNLPFALVPHWDPRMMTLHILVKPTYFTVFGASASCCSNVRCEMRL